MANEEDDPPTAKTNALITASSYFLGLRNFADAKTYALRAQSSAPYPPDPPRLLSILSVLSTPKISPTLPDHYAILKLSRFESDPNRIRSTFTNLTAILNPNTNTHPFSAEAYDSVLKAWSVISNPVEKASFDQELRRTAGSSTSGTDSSTFWTMCPYCYYVYEYDRLYEECCMRCSNGNCRRAFQSVEIVGGNPPAEVIEQGYYRCQSVVLTGDDEVGGWVPYVPKRKAGVVDQDNINVIEISDEEVEEKDTGKRTKVESGAIVSLGNAASGGGEVEFYEGEDDVLVSLHDDFGLSD